MSKPEFVDIVQAGIQIQQQLSADRMVALAEQQRKAREDTLAELAKEASRRTQYAADAAKELAERWAMLEQFHPEERLTQVNNIPGISWGGTSTIRKKDTSLGNAEYDLSYDYGEYYIEGDGDSGVTRRVYGTFNTNLTIGVGHRRFFPEYPTGQYYHGGNGLYVREQHASLTPITPADTFNDLVPMSLRRDLGNSYTPHMVVVDVDHPQASDILTELLARSSIRRFGGRMGGLPVSEQLKPTATRGFWSRIFR